MIGIGIATLGPSAPAPEASAVVLFERAAERAQALPSEVSAGQFLRIEDKWETADSLPRSSGVEASFHSAERIVTYVPADRSGDWVVRRSGSRLVGPVSPSENPEAERLARVYLADPQLSSQAGEDVWPEGVPSQEHEDRSAPDFQRTLDGQRSQYGEAPHNPEQLLKYIHADIRANEQNQRSGNDLDSDVFEWLFPIIRNESFPAEFRAAGFRVLAGLAEKNDHSMESYTVEPGDDGEQVIAFPARGSVRELRFNSSGDLLEYRELVTDEHNWAKEVEPGTVLTSIKTRSTVVDAVPAAEQWPAL